MLKLCPYLDLEALLVSSLYQHVPGHWTDIVEGITFSMTLRPYIVGRYNFSLDTDLILLKVQLSSGHHDPIWLISNDTNTRGHANNMTSSAFGALRGVGLQYSGHISSSLYDHLKAVQHNLHQ